MLELGEILGISRWTNLNGLSWEQAQAFFRVNGNFEQSGFEKTSLHSQLQKRDKNYQHVSLTEMITNVPNLEIIPGRRLFCNLH